MLSYELLLDVMGYSSGDKADEWPQYTRLDS